MPVSAFEALSQGRLDAEFFNVTSLIAQGYDDLSRDTLPVIVGGAGGLTRAAGVSTTAQLESIDAVAASIDKTTGTRALGPALARSSSARIWLDAKVWSTAALGAGDRGSERQHRGRPVGDERAHRDLSGDAHPAARGLGLLQRVSAASGSPVARARCLVVWGPTSTAEA